MWEVGVVAGMEKVASMEGFQKSLDKKTLAELATMIKRTGKRMGTMSAKGERGLNKTRHALYQAQTRNEVVNKPDLVRLWGKNRRNIN